MNWDNSGEWVLVNSCYRWDIEQYVTIQYVEIYHNFEISLIKWYQDVKSNVHASLKTWKTHKAIDSKHIDINHRTWRLISIDQLSE